MGLCPDDGLDDTNTAKVEKQATTENKPMSVPAPAPTTTAIKE